MSMSELRDTFLRSDFDRVEETLVAREARLKAEIEEKKREIGLLQEKIQFERLEKISVEMELKRVKQERHVEENGNEFSLDVSNKAVKAELGRESCELEALENAREMRRMKLRAKRNIMDQDGVSNALTPQRQSSESLPRNSPPAKKKKRPVGESSPNTPFEANLFRSAEHQRKYENKMEGKAFVSEKSFDLGNLREYPEIKMQIQNRKWEALMTVPRLFSAQVVKEFYVNVYTESKGKDQFKSFVRGKEVKFDSRSINKMLKIPEVECEYEEMVSRDLGEEEAKVILRQYLS